MTEQTRGVDDLLKAAGGTQDLLAAAMGRTQQTVSLWLKKGYMPPNRAREAEGMFGIPKRRLINPELLDLIGD